jgi:acetyl/propionyl-CoA carboxylase alpha subunit
VVGARAEAKSAFGDDALIVERFVARGRHVEVQVLGDKSGKVVALGTRDCSVQRRRQKLVEEAPAWWLSEKQRAEMERQAEKVCERAGYVTAGTVEFLVDLDNGRHYFLEVNTRLQVEHTVTEEVLGVDLVRLQILTARGALLSELSVPNRAVRGHAIQVRLCAEDEELQPSVGVLALVRWPTQSYVRIEAGVESGSEVGPHYDSMVAKLIVSAPSRAECVARAAAALRATRLVGDVAVNIGTLLRVLQSREFNENTHTTDWLRPLGVFEEQIEDKAILEALAAQFASSPDSHASGVYRNVAPKNGGGGRLLLTLLGAQKTIRLRYDANGGLFTASGERIGSLAQRLSEAGLWRTSEGKTVETGQFRRARDGALLVWAALRNEPSRVFVVGDRRAWHKDDARLNDQDGGGGGGAGGEYLATMPGAVRACSLAEGASVKRGDTLLVMESMKMEIKIRAHSDGVVSYLVKPGQQVQEGTKLLSIKQANKL